MQQLGLFDSSSEVKTFDALRTEYEQKLALAGAEPYTHAYDRLIWCTKHEHPVKALERKLFITNKLLARESSEHYETQRTIYEQELVSFNAASELDCR